MGQGWRMRNNGVVRLSAQPDGFGFYYGHVWRDGTAVRVDVLPPASLWRGEIIMTDTKPDPKAWTVFFDGEEVARIERREDLSRLGVTLAALPEPAVAPTLPRRWWPSSGPRS